MILSSITSISIHGKENLVHNDISSLIRIYNPGASGIGINCLFMKLGKLTWSTGHFMA